jgi:small subunit ribosomal protein S21
MTYRKKNFRKRPKDDSIGLSVKVYNNNIEGALKAFKKKVKNSGILEDLKQRQYYEKPSKLKREKKNLAILRNKYAVEKEKENN